MCEQPLPLELWEKIALFSEDHSSLSLVSTVTNLACKEMGEVVHTSFRSFVLQARPTFFEAGKGFFQEQYVTLRFREEESRVVFFFVARPERVLTLKSITLECFGVHCLILCDFAWCGEVDLLLPRLGSMRRFARVWKNARKEEVVSFLRGRGIASDS